jgi:hypothetical protein
MNDHSMLVRHVKMALEQNGIKWQPYTRGWDTDSEDLARDWFEVAKELPSCHLLEYQKPTEGGGSWIPKWAVVWLQRPKRDTSRKKQQRLAAFKSYFKDSRSNTANLQP